MLTPQPSTNKWVHATLTVGLSSTAVGVVSLTIDDATSDAGTASAMITGVVTVGPPTPPYPMLLSLGVTVPSSPQPPNPMSFYYDNVLVYLQ